MQAPFDRNLKTFLQSIKDPSKKKAVQLLFLSNRNYSELADGLSIQRVSNEERSKLAS